MRSPPTTQSDASIMLPKRPMRRLLTSSSIAATVQVAPRWMAKPMTPARMAAARKARLVRTICMDMALSKRLRKSRGAPLVGAPRCIAARRCDRQTCRRLHVLHHGFGLLVVHDVGNRQYRRLRALVFPPVLDTQELARDLALLVQYRHRALAAVFVDLALDDHDQRRTVLVAVKGHDAACPDFHVAKAKAVLRQLDVFLRKVDRRELHFGNADGSGCRAGKRVGADFVRRALTCEYRRCGEESRQAREQNGLNTATAIER